MTNILRSAVTRYHLPNFNCSIWTSENQDVRASILMKYYRQDRCYGHHGSIEACNIEKLRYTPKRPLSGRGPVENSLAVSVEIQPQNVNAAFNRLLSFKSTIQRSIFSHRFPPSRGAIRSFDGKSFSGGFSIPRLRLFAGSSSSSSSDLGTPHHEFHYEGSNHHESSGGLSALPLLGFLGFINNILGNTSEDGEEKLSEATLEKMRPIDRFIALGVLALCDKEHSKADELFHEALKIAQEDEDEEQQTLVLNLLASNYYESGELDKAEKLFLNIMQRLTAQGVEATDPAIIELSLKLASIYSEMPSTRAKATEGYKFVIISLTANLKDLLSELDEIDIQSVTEEAKNSLALLGWGYDWFAKHLMLLNDYDGAIKMLRKALEISTKVLGPNHDQTLILLNDLGTTLAMKDSPEEGKAFIKKAVQGAIDGKSKQLASFYVNLGLVSLRLNSLAEAKRYCEYSVELAQRDRELYNYHDVIRLSKDCLSDIERISKQESG